MTATTVDWWMSTKSKPNMFRPAYQTDELDAFLRQNRGVDPALLGAELGMSADRVMAYQRKIGLRRITGNGDYPGKKATKA